MKNAKNKSQDKLTEILNAMTLQQKIALCSGKNEWDTKEIRDKNHKLLVPSVKVADGPHGLRKTIGDGDNLGLAGSKEATCFPAECLVACSFDRELAKSMGEAIANEARLEGVCTVLGPGVNIKRNPLCGRNFEYYSEDPFLSGRLAAAYIHGMQSRGIGSSIKHFACNSQEYYRMTSDSQVDERTLREIYLSAFEYAIKDAKPMTVMCGYNRINGVACSDNVKLLDTILRKEWGYEGLVVSDWGALNNRIAAFKAGCDLIMPGGSAYEEIDAYKAAVAGDLDEKYIDRSARRVAQFAIKQHLSMQDRQKKYPLPKQSEVLEQSHKLAQKIAEESAVLLKNDNALLPLDFEKDTSNVCVIGSMAEAFRFQGSGSSKINPSKVEKVFDYLSMPYKPGYSMTGQTTKEQMDEAVALAKESHQVILFAGLPETFEAEGLDRRHMELPQQQNQLIDAVSKANDNVIVILISGCVVEIPWADQVKSILWMGLSGQAGARALYSILSGKVNPSGKLAETWPMKYEDCKSASIYLKDRNASYKERFYVGYRYYDKKKVKVRYPFGHGMSYTSFSYSDIRTDGNQVYVTVTNTGNRAGAEAVLCYIMAPQDGIERPVKELKGFEKIFLELGEKKEVGFMLDDRAFAVWNGAFKVYSGQYRICIGDLSIEKEVIGETFDGKLYDAPLHVANFTKNKKYDVNSTIAELSDKVLLLKLLYRWFDKKQEQTYGRDSIEYLSAMSVANECPIRGVQIFIGIKHHFAQAMADFANREYIKGVKHLLS